MGVGYGLTKSPRFLSPGFSQNHFKTLALSLSRPHCQAWHVDVHIKLQPDMLMSISNCSAALAVVVIKETLRLSSTSRIPISEFIQLFSSSGLTILEFWLTQSFSVLCIFRALHLLESSGYTTLQYHNWKMQPLFAGVCRRCKQLPHSWYSYNFYVKQIVYFKLELYLYSKEIISNKYLWNIVLV